VIVADEVGRLQRGGDPECRFFQSFSEFGHYGGRSRPTGTRQGTYAVAPSGKFLASINSRSPAHMARMLETALAAWRKLPKDERLRKDDPKARTDANQRFEERFPNGGLAMRVTTRDLPRGSDTLKNWRANAWNEDQAWFKAEEIRAMFARAATAEKGATWDAPAAVARRLARCHLVDYVRGQTIAYKDREVERATLRVTVESIKRGIVKLRLEGGSRTVANGRWHVGGDGGTGDRTGEQSRGYDSTWFGYAEWDVKSATLKKFELLTTGLRWGGTRYNARHDDLDPGPMATVFELIEVTPETLVAPAQMWSYGW